MENDGHVKLSEEKKSEGPRVDLTSDKADEGPSDEDVVVVQPAETGLEPDMRLRVCVPVTRMTLTSKYWCAAAATAPCATAGSGRRASAKANAGYVGLWHQALLPARSGVFVCRYGRQTEGVTAKAGDTAKEGDTAKAGVTVKQSSQKSQSRFFWVCGIKPCRRCNRINVCAGPPLSESKASDGVSKIEGTTMTVEDCINSLTGQLQFVLQDTMRTKPTKSAVHHAGPIVTSTLAAMKNLAADQGRSMTKEQFETAFKKALDLQDAMMTMQDDVKETVLLAIGVALQNTFNTRQQMTMAPKTVLPSTVSKPSKRRLEEEAARQVVATGEEMPQVGKTMAKRRKTNPAGTTTKKTHVNEVIVDKHKKPMRDASGRSEHAAASGDWVCCIVLCSLWS